MSSRNLLLDFEFDVITGLTDRQVHTWLAVRPQEEKLTL